MTAHKPASSAIPTTGYIRRFRMPELLGVSLPTIDRWVKNGTLPRPVKLTDNVTAFDAVEINNWLAERRGRWPDGKENRPLQAANSDIRVSDITPLTKSFKHQSAHRKSIVPESICCVLV